MINHTPLNVLKKISKHQRSKNSDVNKRLKNMSFINPKFIPFHYFNPIDKLNFRLIKNSISTEFDQQRNFIWANYINGTVYEFFLKADYKVLDIWTRRQVNEHLSKKAKKLEEEAVKIADLVIIDSLQTYSDYKGLNENMVVIPHGVDINRFIGFEPNKKLQKLKKNKFVVGYCGALHEHIDYELLFTVIEVLKEVQFIFVGNIIDERAYKLKEYQNVEMTGRVSYKDLGYYYKLFDIGIIPYKTEGRSSGIVPTKFFEYLANGVPVLASELKDITKHRNNFIHFHANNIQFIQYVRKVLNGDQNIKQEEIINFAKQHTWESRFENILSNM